MNHFSIKFSSISVISFQSIYHHFHMINHIYTSPRLGLTATVHRHEPTTIQLHPKCSSTPWPSTWAYFRGAIPRKAETRAIVSCNVSWQTGPAQRSVSWGSPLCAHGGSQPARWVPDNFSWRVVLGWQGSGTSGWSDCGYAGRVVCKERCSGR